MQTELDLNGPQTMARDLQQQVDFRAGAGPIEERNGVPRGGPDEIFHRESLPTCARDGVSEQRVVVGNIQQRVHDAAVTNEYLRRFHQPFTDIAVKRLEPAHEHEIHHEVEISRYGFSVDRKAAGELSRVEQTALHMGEHGPEPGESGGWNSGCELGDIALQVGPDEVLTPDEAAGIAGRQKAFREPAARSEAAQSLAGFTANLQNVERRQLDVSDPARQRLGLPEQIA